MEGTVRFLLLALLLLTVAPSALAVPIVLDFSNGPVVFDFEDGTQGWQLSGGAVRVETDVLGGDWAIYLGEALYPTSISLHVDLSNVAGIGVERHLLMSLPAPLAWVSADLGEVDLVDGYFLGVQRALLPLIQDAGPSPPGYVSIPPTATEYVTLLLWKPPAIQEGPGEELFTSPGYIDNVTFYPIPEPSTALLVTGGALLLALRRLREAMKTLHQLPSPDDRIDPWQRRR